MENEQILYLDPSLQIGRSKLILGRAHRYYTNSKHANQ